MRIIKPLSLAACALLVLAGCGSSNNSAKENPSASASVSASASSSAKGSAKASSGSTNSGAAQNGSSQAGSSQAGSAQAGGAQSSSAQNSQAAQNGSTQAGTSEASPSDGRTVENPPPRPPAQSGIPPYPAGTVLPSEYKLDPNDPRYVNERVISYDYRITGEGEITFDVHVTGQGCTGYRWVAQEVNNTLYISFIEGEFPGVQGNCHAPDQVHQVKINTFIYANLLTLAPAPAELANLRTS